MLRFRSAGKQFGSILKNQYQPNRVSFHSYFSRTQSINPIFKIQQRCFSQTPILFRKETVFRRPQPKETIPSTESAIEQVYTNDKRSTYSKWMVLGFIQLAVMIIMSSLLAKIRQYKVNVTRLEENRDRLTEIDTKESITQEEQEEKVKIDYKM